MSAPEGFVNLNVTYTILVSQDDYELAKRLAVKEEEEGDENFTDEEWTALEELEDKVNDEIRSQQCGYMDLAFATVVDE